MGIQCRIIKDDSGKVSYVEAPNGSRSKLYDDAVTQLGEEAALDAVLVAYTPSFTEDVKNPKIAAFRKELIKRINDLPTMVNNITLNLGNIDYSVDISTLQPQYEYLGNGETLISFKADMDSYMEVIEYNDEFNAWMVWSDEFGGELEVFLDKTASEGEVLLEARNYIEGLKQELKEDSMPTVYRGINGEFSDKFEGIQYFAEQKSYAKVWGQNVESFTIDNTEDVLNLEDWNKKWGIDDGMFGQGYLTVHSDIMNNPLELEERLYIKLTNKFSEAEAADEVDAFMKAFYKAKAVYGEDVGNKGQMVYAVKDKTIVKPKNRNIRFSIGNTSTLSENKTGATQKFFSDVVEGKDKKFIAKKEWTPILDFSKVEQKFKEVYDNFKGNFDTHIATSIPTFRETQIKVGAAISNMLKDGGLVYDIGGSEGGFVKTITSETKGKARSINLDVNESMGKYHNTNPVEGSEFVNEAFYEGYTDEDTGVTYKKHVPSEKADVVHESMVFQFITPERKQFIKEIKDNYIKEDGIVLLEEKLLPETEEEWIANERKKDEHKLQYYTQEELNTKSDKVLVGMKKNQTKEADLLEALNEEFKYVGKYWDAGNFKGYYATNSEAKAKEFMKELGKPITSEFSQQIRKAPNGKTSNLNAAQYEEVRTPAFMEWSNNWKDVVKDENGEPQVHFHGSPQDRFYTFKSGIGLEFFSPTKKVAETYMGFNEPTEGMYEVYLKSPKTLDVSKEVPAEVENFMKENLEDINKYLKEEDMDDLSYDPMTTASIAFKKQEGKSWKDISPFKRLMHMMTKNKYNWQILEYPPFVEFLKENGYTALKTLENDGNIGMFYPNDIKSAEENVGTFSSETSDIRYSEGENNSTSEEALQGLADRLSDTGLAKEVNIVSEQEIKEALEQKGHKYQQGINGFALNDIVYINKERAGLDTPIHEFGHLWNSWMQENAPEVYKKGISLIKEQGQEYINFVKQTQPKLKGEDLYEEALAQAIGDNGKKLVEGQGKESFMDWLKSVWNNIKDALGLADTSLEEFQNLTLDEFTKRAATDLLKGESLQDLMDSQAGTVGAAFTVKDNAPLTPSKTIERFEYDTDFTTTLPRKTMKEVIEEYDGKVFGITSDATGTGYDSNGDRIDGGIGFMSIKDNVESGIGFASLDTLTVRRTLGKAMKRYKGGEKVAFLVMIQNADATVGNYYGAKYFGRGLRLLKEQRPQEYDAIVESVMKYIDSKKGVRKDFVDKYKDGELTRKGTIEAFHQLLKDVDKYDEVGFANEFIKDTTFDARRKLLQGLIIPNGETRTDKSTPLVKQALKDIGFNQLEYLKEYGDTTIFTEEMFKENAGGFFAGGFEFTIPKNEAELNDAVTQVEDKGITHPQFNGKIPTTGNNFYFDGLYPVNENFAEFAKPNILINYKKIKKEEVDKLVRKTFKKETDYVASVRKGAKNYIPKSKRSYTNLSVTNKGIFKDMLEKMNPDYLKEKETNAAVDIARGMGYFPENDATRNDLVRKASESTLLKMSIQQQYTRGQFSGMLMRGQWGMLTGENPDAKELNPEENAKRNAEAEAWLERRGYFPTPIIGNYGNRENSFFVQNLNKQDALDFAIKFGQESVATNEGLIFQNGTMIPRLRRKDSQGGTYKDNYSTINLDGQEFNFTIGFEGKAVDAGNLTIKSVAEIDKETATLQRGDIPFLDMDGEGNYVFYHYSFGERDVIDPKKVGSNPQDFTSSEEKTALTRVGGVSMYYTKTRDKESKVGSYGHLVKVPMEKVYDVNSDPKGLLERAEKKFRQKYPNAAWDSNHQVAFVTKEANKLGYEMAVAEWTSGKYRAQTTVPLKPAEKEVVEGNVLKQSFTDYSSGKPKFSIGFAQTQDKGDTEQVKLSNVDDKVQGKGVGTEMYKQMAKNALKQGKSLISDFNAKGAKGIWDNFINNDIAGKKEVEGQEVTAIKTLPEDSFDSNGEPLVEEVIKYIQSRNYENSILSDTEQNQVRNVMIGTSIKDSQELYEKLRKAFMPNGVYNPSETSLRASGLYSKVEARNLLDGVANQVIAYEMLHKLKNSDTIKNDTEVDSAYVTLNTRFNSFGMLEKGNPFINRKNAVDKLGGIKDENIFRNQAEAYNLEFANRKFAELSKLKRMKVNTIGQEGITPQTSKRRLVEKLEETLTQPSNGAFVESINYILEIPSDIWNLDFTSVKALLEDVEATSVDIGLDLSQLSEKAYDRTPQEVKDLLNSVRNFAIMQNEATFDILTDTYIDFFEISEEQETIAVPVSQEEVSKTLVYGKSDLTSYELFDKYGLLPLSKNLYQKVNTEKSFEETVDVIYRTLPTRNDIIPKNALYSAFNGDILDIEFIKNPQNEEFVKEDIRKYANKESKKIDTNGKVNTDTLKKMVLFSKFFKTQLNQSPNVPSVQVEQELMVNYPKNAKYLMGEFIADFNKEILKSKLNNTPKYREFYSNFTVTSEGIELVNTDPITMRNIQPYLTDNLVNHFRLKKEGTDLRLDKETDAGFTNDVTLRNYYGNFPKALPKFTGVYQLDNNRLLANLSTDFIRVDEGVFEYIETVGNKAVYGKILTNGAGFKVYKANLSAPEIGDVSKFKTNSAIKADKKVKDLYTKKQDKEITNEIDNC